METDFIPMQDLGPLEKRKQIAVQRPTGSLAQPALWLQFFWLGKDGDIFVWICLLVIPTEVCSSSSQKGSGQPYLGAVDTHCCGDFPVLVLHGLGRLHTPKSL
jgi:hypothetical protein